MTISTNRSNGYYIGRTRLVDSLIFRCVTCRRLRHNPQIQKMDNLPKERTEPSLPFPNIAQDCIIWSIHLTGRKKAIKSYGLLIVCQASIAMPIEVLDDMTTDLFSEWT